MEELAELADTILQGTALLADDDPSEDRPSRRGSSFLTVVAIGNVVRIYTLRSGRPDYPCLS
jgi:dynamin 1/3